MTFLRRPHTLLSHNDSPGFPGFPSTSLYPKDPLTVSHRERNSKCCRQYGKCLFHKTGSPEVGWLQDSEWNGSTTSSSLRVLSFCFALLSVGLLLGCYSPPHDDKRAADVPGITSSRDTSGG